MNYSSTAKADLQDIATSLDIILEPGSLAELRVPNTAKGTASGYFMDFAKLGQVAAGLSGQAPGVYVTLNPVNPNLLARAANRVIPYAKHATTDSDIVHRRWLPVDIDAVRPAGVSSTAEEHETALDRAHRAVYDFLVSAGFPENSLVRGDSGNGGHVLARVDLPNDQASAALLQRCLQALDLRFSDGGAQVDLTTYNAARLWRVPGTLNAKGDSTPDRPHRLARLLVTPRQIMPAPREALEGLAAMAPEVTKPERPTAAGREAFDLRTWIEVRNLPVVRHGPWGNGGYKWIVSPCPWNPDHTDRAAYIVQHANGAIAAGCHHNGCADKDWDALRNLLEPGWREKARGRGDGQGGAEAGKAANKQPQAQALVGLVSESGAELFHDERSVPYAALSGPGTKVLGLGQGAFRLWLSQRFYRERGNVPNSEGLRAAINTLSGIAVHAGSCYPLAVRVAAHDGAFWYDLGDGRAVRTTMVDWSIVDKPPILFRRFPHQVPQVAPSPGGKLDLLLNFLNLKDRGDKLLLLAYVVAALVPDIPHPVLLLHGDQGSGKSTAFKLLKMLIDPSIVVHVSPPDSVRDFVIGAFQHHAVYLDNLTHLPSWLSDSLARLSTGEGFSHRELYSDSDTVVFSLRRLGGLNGINLVADRPDLLDRAVILALDSIPPNRRRTENSLWAEFNEAKPAILGGLFDALAEAMSGYPKVQLRSLPRMADFALWGCAAARALGFTEEDFLLAYESNVAQQNAQALDASPVAQALLSFMDRRDVWEGEASALYSELVTVAETLKLDRDRDFPKSANWLWRRLKPVRANLMALGLEVSLRREKAGTVISITRLQEETKNDATAATESEMLPSQRWRQNQDLATLPRCCHASPPLRLLLDR